MCACANCCNGNGTHINERYDIMYDIHWYLLKKYSDLKYIISSGFFYFLYYIIYDILIYQYILNMYLSVKYKKKKKFL